MIFIGGYMKIIYEKENYHFGTFCVKFEEKYFPYENWSDFYIWIIIDWINVIFENENKNISDFRLDVMEGSHYLLCTKNYDKISIVGVYNDKANVLFGEFEFSLLKDILLDARKQILQNAKKSLIWNDDLRSLQSIV